jgi:UrcA family protein
MWLGPVETTHSATTGIVTEEKAMKTIALIAAVLLAGSGLAHAEDATTVVGTSPIVEHVPYQPSELASEHGIRDLRKRVRLATFRVCAPVPDDFIVGFDLHNCTGPTLHSAYAQVDRAAADWRNGKQASAGSIAVRVR